MADNLINISNLVCRYENSRDILRVENFHIDQGEIVFLLGPSGIGKSTLIEVIGLINNTASASDNAIMTYYHGDNDKTDLIKLWTKKDDSLEIFRRDHFSFIFQNNYLMPNLTAGDNMMITLLMKGDTEQEAKEKIRYYMNIVNLDDEVFDKPIYYLSGGQKQRLAFVRAIAAPFELLIGDEPTGNLDSITAQKLMAFTRNSILQHNKSGLFVSHDIHLALNYADRIYVFKPISEDNNIIGFIDENASIIKKDNRWCDKDGVLVNPFQTVLDNFDDIIY